MTVQPGAPLYTQGFGTRPENVEVPVVSTTSPTPQNASQYPIGKRWINTVSPSEHTLCSFSSAQGVTSAVWTAGSLVLMGVTGPLVNGVVIVSNPLIQATSFVMFCCNNLQQEIGDWQVANITNGSFQITSTNTSDASTFFYFVFNP